MLFKVSLWNGSVKCSTLKLWERKIERHILVQSNACKFFICVLYRAWRHGMNPTMSSSMCSIVRRNFYCIKVLLYSTLIGSMRSRLDRVDTLLPLLPEDKNNFHFFTHRQMSAVFTWLQYPIVTGLIGFPLSPSYSGENAHFIFMI